MPQISRKPLDKDIEDEIFRQFWNAFEKVTTATEASDFLGDLLTDTEKVMVAKRFTIALLLLRGKTTTEIRSAIHVSFATIGSVSSWLKNAKPQTQRIFKKLSRNKGIEELLDKLPPR